MAVETISSSPDTASVAAVNYPVLVVETKEC